MFRRYPYWGWLALCLVLWCVNGYDFHTHRQDLLPERMANAINKDFQHRADVWAGFSIEKDLIRRIYSDSLTPQEVARINHFPFHFYCYDNDTLHYWNSNSVIAVNSDTALGRAVIVHNEKGVFIQKCVKPDFLPGNKRIVVLFPVLITYPLENEYLKSHFVASDYIPVKTRIQSPDKHAPDAYPIARDNIPVFYLHFNHSDIQKWTPDALFIMLLIAAILATISWVQLMTIHLTRNRSFLAGLLIILAIIAIIKVLLYNYGLPFNLDTLTFFSPRLYASSKYLSSFGDLFIDCLCVLWLVVFITRQTPYKSYFNNLKINWLRYLVTVAISLALTAYVFLFVNVIRSLVLDSSISFDVSHFYAINVYTILGLLVIGTITGISCLIIYLLNIQLRQLVLNKWAKLLLAAIVSTCYLLLAGKAGDLFSWSLTGWLLLFLVIMDIRNLTLVSDLFEPHMIFWAVFICVFCTGILQYFNQIKEREARIAFVERLSPHRDNVMEYAFDKIADTIEKDHQLKSFLYKPSANARRAIDQHFDAQYLSGPVAKYQVKLYLFDPAKNPLFNKDTTDYYSLWIEKNESYATVSPFLFYKESILDRHYYLSYIPVYNDTTNTVPLGYVIIDLDLKKQLAQKTVYPELLQPSGNKANAEENEYAYAIYLNNKLITQTNDYPFTIDLPPDSLKENESVFFNNKGISELHYKTADKRTIVAVHYHSEWLETITLFSYLFGTQVLLALVILLYQLYLSYFTGAFSTGKFIRLTLRRRVHFSMLAVVLISFLIIGTVTILFFTNQYRSSNSNKLQAAMQVAKQSVQDYLKKENGYYADYVFDSVSRSTRFKLFITNIANTQNIDINVFDDKGTLYASSQDDIYDKGLIARVMRPDAFYQLNSLGKSIVKQDENVAQLFYLSGYEPLRDDHGITLGYINVPFFSSERDLNFQISNIVVTLINLYSFIFLLSSLVTVIITRWITRTFNVIIKQFGRINLQRNERIAWPYDDEIGLLVSEYNKMVNKVEENAAMLAQSERESAWREMARQVAHEIKNPLTPMKLNIQYLQQAMKGNHPNIKDLTNKVSESIIEQIDNLSYIASEFSNFAKMPEARPEELEVTELLNKAVELYLNDDHVKVSIVKPAGQLFLFADRSQLLRVFTNLLENAKQAIPDDRNGIINVELRSEGDDVLISIADNGAGIDAESIKKIFQPYFTTKSSGTGLGLAMTRKIIEFWKGTIWFETTEKAGTVFYIRLPLVKKESASDLS
jgi:signal transduction histidine kinase